MAETTDIPGQPSEADNAPVVDTPVGEPVTGQTDSSLTAELEAVVSRIDADEPAETALEADVAPAAEGAPEADTSPETDIAPEADTSPETDIAPEADTSPESDVAPETEPTPEADEDEIEAAISSAEEKVAAEPTLDDIAPGTVAHDPEAAPVESAVAPVSHAVPWWPFVVYDVLWLVFAGALVWYFEQLPPGTAVFESPLYGITILVGVVLAALGPALILATWIGTLGRDGASKSALFFSALVRGSVATAVGVALWWVALLVLDQLRLGRVL